MLALFYDKKNYWKIVTYALLNHILKCKNICGGTIMVFKMQESVQIPNYMTYSQFNIIIAVQKLWFKISILVREYTKAAIFDTPNLKSISNNILIDLPSEVYELFSIFYGTINGQILKDLFSDFIKSMMAVVEAIKYGDKILINSTVINWYQSADKIASFLGSVNVFWDESQWRYLLYEYIKLRINEITALANGDYEQDMEQLNTIENVSFLMASYMGRGIIASNLQPIQSNKIENKNNTNPYVYY